jgi:hypothetical protein
MRSIAQTCVFPRGARGFRRRLPCLYQWCVDDVLRHKPHLQFVPSDDVADDQIVAPVIAALGRQARHRPSLFQHDLVRMLVTCVF